MFWRGFFINNRKMKVVTTQNRTGVIVSWSELETLISNGIGEERFIVLYDKNTQNYVQMAEDDGNFVVEARLYNKNKFLHYRTYVENSDEAISVFKNFFNDKENDYSAWEDVTTEFLD